MKAIFSSVRHHYMAGLSIFLVVATLMAGLAGCGSRPAVNAIEIRDWYDLAAIANNMTADYVLENDLDATTDGWEELASPTANDGKGWKPIAAIDTQPQFAHFSGIFDGQGHEIKDLFINRPDENYVGLFIFINLWGVIRNIGVVNANVTGGERVGGLVGSNPGIVSNSYFTGTVTGNYLVGGLSGINFGTMSNCYATGNVTGDERVGGLLGNNQGTVSGSYSTGNVTGNYFVGGLIGISFNTTSNCYASGNVTGDERVGGLIGENQGIVSSSYSTGNVTGNSFVGGLVGLDLGTVANSFWDTETSGQATSAGGTGKTTAEMQDIATFSGATWDIIVVANPSVRNPAYIWNIVDDETYPFLSWQP